MSKEKQWERVQERAFTQWLAQTLQPRNITVADLRFDIQDGVALINFFELLSGKRCKGYDPRPKNRINKINNLSVAFQFLSREIDVVNPGCAAEDVIDAESKGIKMILGLLWTLFRRYRMRVDDSGGSKLKEEDMMLEWVRKTTAGYSLDVKSFRSSFNDGKVFLALVHAYNKENPTFDFADIATKPTEEVLTTAFNLAETDLGVNKLLDIQEILDGNSDERSMALYTSLIHHAFKTKQEMLEMQKRLGNQNEQLSLEMQSKESLLKTNRDLTMSVDQLKKTLSEEQEHCEHLNRIFEDLKNERDKNADEIADLRAKIADLKEKIEKLSADKAGRTKELSDAILEETKLKSDVQKELDDVASKKETLQSQIDDLKQEIADLNASNIETTKNLAAHRKTADLVEGNGLSCLRENLLAHLHDLHVWEGILDGTADSIEKQVEKVTNNEVKIDGTNEIIMQLQELSKELEKDNDIMVALLKKKKEKEIPTKSAKKKKEVNEHSSKHKPKKDKSSTTLSSVESKESLTKSSSSKDKGDVEGEVGELKKKKHHTKEKKATAV